MEKIIQRVKFSIFNMGNFTGRASRTEYWTYMLTMGTLVLGTLFLLGILSIIFQNPVFLSFYLIIGPVFLISLIPWVALCVRRIHDAGQTGWLVLLAFVPVLSVVPVILSFIPSAKPNKWGDGPAEIAEINEFSAFSFQFENL